MRHIFDLELSFSMISLSLVIHFHYFQTLFVSQDFLLVHSVLFCNFSSSKHLPQLFLVQKVFVKVSLLSKELWLERKREFELWSTLSALFAVNFFFRLGVFATLIFSCNFSLLASDTAYSCYHSCLGLLHCNSSSLWSLLWNWTSRISGSSSELSLTWNFTTPFRFCLLSSPVSHISKLSPRSRFTLKKLAWLWAWFCTWLCVLDCGPVD